LSEVEKLKIDPNKFKNPPYGGFLDLFGLLK